MRFDAYIRGLEASLSMRSFPSRRSPAKSTLVCITPKRNEGTPSYLTYSDLVASKIRVAILPSHRSDAKTFQCAAAQVFFVLFLDLETMEMLTLPFPICSL